MCTKATSILRLVSVVVLLIAMVGQVGVVRAATVVVQSVGVSHITPTPIDNDFTRIDNAIHAAAALAAHLASWPLPSSPRTALTVSRIGGGSAVNAIPANAAIEIDVRSTSAGELERLDDEIHAAAARVLDTQNRQ